MKKFINSQKIRIYSLAITVCVFIAVTTIVSHISNDKIYSNIYYIDINAVALATNNINHYQSGVTSHNQPLPENLRRILEEFATKRSITIFDKSVVIAGGNDITEEVIAYLKR